MSELKLHRQKPKKSPVGKGFYIALAVCVLAVAAVTWSAFGRSSGVTGLDSSNVSLLTSSQASSAESDVSTSSAASKAPVSSKPVSQKPSSAPSVASKAPDPSSAIQTNTKPIQYLMPVAGKVTKEYSPEKPVYSLTFSDWRVHDGVDLAASKGATVQSAADGKVTDVYEDDRYGTVVVISYSDGLQLSYCGLSPSVVVKKGDAVKAGQTIGSVFEVPCEVAEEAHLHLEAKKDGKSVDPLNALGKQAAANSSAPSESKR